MKTTSQKKSNKLPRESKQLEQTAQTTSAPAPVITKQDTRLPIDSEARKANRTLPTNKVLEMLQQTSPGLFNMAEVVGKWIWVTFRETPAPEQRQQLSQLGFHWNRERQSWQHPCGAFRLSSNGDPREKYTSHFPADIQPQ